MRQRGQCLSHLTPPQHRWARKTHPRNSSNLASSPDPAQHQIKSAGGSHPAWFQRVGWHPGTFSPPLCHPQIQLRLNPVLLHAGSFSPPMQSPFPSTRHLVGWLFQSFSQPPFLHSVSQLRKGFWLLLELIFLAANGALNTLLGLQASPLTVVSDGIFLQ